MSYFTEDLEYNIAFAKTTIKETGDLSSMVVGVVGSDRVVYPFSFGNEKEQKAQADIIKVKLRQVGGTALIVFAKVWGVKLRHPALYSPDFQAVDHLDRKECFLILYVQKITATRVVIPIFKILGSIEFGEKSVWKYKTVNDKIWGNTFMGGQIT